MKTLHPFASRRTLSSGCLLSTLFALLLASPALAANSERLLQQIGVARGICAIVGENAGPIANELAKDSELTLWVRSPSEADALAVRRSAEAAGMLGSRIYVEQGDADRLSLAHQSRRGFCGGRQRALGSSSRELPAHHSRRRALRHGPHRHEQEVRPSHRQDPCRSRLLPRQLHPRHRNG